MPLTPSSLYKDIQTSRGLNYHYYSSPATREGKATLVFLHGYPSTSYDWRHQVPFFQDKGYGIIVPDMLGYGGTSKPLDVAKYKYSLIAKDIVDILDAEGIYKVVLIAHDWGSIIACRFLQHIPDRVQAIALLASGYIPPTPDFDYEKILAYSKQLVGYETFGYWAFLSQDSAPKLIEDNRDKFIHVLYPEDPETWKIDFAPRGALEECLTNKPAVAAPSWISKEELKIHADDLFAGGLAAPNHWYKYVMSSYFTEDDATIPQDRYKTTKPVFLGVARKDFIVLAHDQIKATKAFAENLTLREFDTNHWIQLQQPNEVNQELEAWLRGF